MEQPEIAKGSQSEFCLQIAFWKEIKSNLANLNELFMKRFSLNDNIFYQTLTTDNFMIVVVVKGVF